MQDLNAENDKQLLELLTRDSEYAFALIFDKYQPRVYSAALAFLKNSDAAEEVVQEVFLRVWQKRKDLGQVNYLNSFIKTIAYNLMVDQFRKTILEKGYIKELSLNTPVVDDTDYRVRNDESVRLLQAAIAALPQRQRQVYELARIKGLSQDEIATALSISKNTVKVHMTAALQSIRAYLSAHYPDTLGSIPVLLLLARMTGK
jgi:RNA polymerase sigma-70 factor (ECF subfamily)